jgi:short-subunit dehydrogenase
MTTALITGATSGLGRGFAEALAAEGHHVVLVARNRERLDALATHLTTNYGIVADVLAADLSVPGPRGKVEKRLRSQDDPVSILVNSAGFGVRQRFVGGDLADEQLMLDVLVTAPMRLTHAVVPGMVERGGGAIINISSVDGWMANSTYSAAKAYVTTFTEGLASELAGTGVSATAVCPGLTHTEFHQRADMDVSQFPEFMWLSVDQVVKQALRDAKKGRAISVAGRQYQAISLAAQYSPRPLVRRLARYQHESENRR